MAVKKSRGFTLLELLVVIAVIALGTAGVVMAMRDSSQTMVEREATRLAALLDAGRAQSRATGSVVTWETVQGDQRQPVMRWSGLKHKEPLPTTWLDAQTQVRTKARWVLGPDPVTAPQTIELRVGTEIRRVVSDGIGAFTVETP